MNLTFLIRFEFDHFDLWSKYSHVICIYSTFCVTVYTQMVRSALPYHLTDSLSIFILDSRSNNNVNAILQCDKIQWHIRIKYEHAVANRMKKPHKFTMNDNGKTTLAYTRWPYAGPYDISAIIQLKSTLNILKMEYFSKMLQTHACMLLYFWIVTVEMCRSMFGSSCVMFHEFSITLMRFLR